MFLSSCYLTRTALHHNELFNSRRPIGEVVADAGTPQKTRSRLERVPPILAFAAGQGLNTEGAYGYFIETGEPVVSYLVQAAEPDRLKSVTWWFPVVGNVPYLGFFEKSARDAKAAELEAQGYDVHTTGVGAFSSLGWFEDPIFSSMLRRSEADLASLLFHELTHRTFWAPGSTKFNENLAEYVAETLTPLYLKSRGQNEAIAQYLQKRADRKLFKAWLKELKEALETLYRNPPANQTTLMQRKAETFARFQKPPLKPDFAEYDYVGKRPWNNARVLGASLYSPDTERFRKAHACLETDTVSGFLEALEAATEDHDDLFEALESLCREKGDRQKAS